MRNDVKISEDILANLPTKNKILPDNAKRDLIISIIHCTRLVGNKADAWFLRQNPKVINLPFKQGIKRADRDNAIDVYISDDYMDILSNVLWEDIFTEKPVLLTREEKKEWLKNLKTVSLGSDAFFPFGDNIERAKKKWSVLYSPNRRVNKR